MQIHAWYFSFWNCETDYSKGFLGSKWGVNQNPFCFQNHLTLEKFPFVSLSLFLFLSLSFLLFSLLCLFLGFPSPLCFSFRILPCLNVCAVANIMAAESSCYSEISTELSMWVDGCYWTIVLPGTDQIVVVEHTSHLLVWMFAILHTAFLFYYTL